MGGFWNTLGQFGQGVGQGMLNNAAQQSPLVGGVYNAYQSNRKKKIANTWAEQQEQNQIDARQQDLNDIPFAPTPSTLDTWDGSTPVQSNTASPLVTDSPQMQPPNPNTIPDSPLAQHQKQGGGLTSMLPMLLAEHGTVVTKPTIVKLGEKEPEMVIPLHPKAGNHIQPDILEGRVSPPRVPGVHYSRYRSFNRLAPGQGGSIA